MREDLSGRKGDETLRSWIEGLNARRLRVGRPPMAWEGENVFSDLLPPQLPCCSLPIFAFHGGHLQCMFNKTQGNEERETGGNCWEISQAIGIILRAKAAQARRAQGAVLLRLAGVEAQLSDLGTPDACIHPSPRFRASFL